MISARERLLRPIASEIEAFLDSSVVKVGVDVSDDPEDPIHRRYVRGQEIYLRRYKPASVATCVILNEKLEAPRISDQCTSVCGRFILTLTPLFEKAIRCWYEDANNRCK